MSGQKPHKDIRNPLCAVMCMQAKGNEKDAAARQKDYENALFSLNQLIGLDCVYHVIKDTNNNENENNTENDEKHAPSESSFVFCKQGTLSNKISISQHNFKTVWTSDEMISFCERVRDIIDGLDKEHNIENKNNYDGLIFIITAPSKQEHFKMEQKEKKGPDFAFTRISDSNDKLTDLKRLFEIFDQDHCQTDHRNFPKIFFVDRYYEFDATKDIPTIKLSEKERERRKNYLIKEMRHEDVNYQQLVNYNLEATRIEDYDYIKMDPKTRVLYFFGHKKPLALINIHETGGAIARAVGKVLSTHPEKWSSHANKAKARDDDFFHECYLYITKLRPKSGVCPVRYIENQKWIAHPYQTEFRLRFPVWEMKE